MLEQIKHATDNHQPSCLLLCGKVLLEVMMQNHSGPEYLLITELDSEIDSNCEISELDLSSLESKSYTLIFTSPDFINVSGTWRFRIYKKI